MGNEKERPLERAEIYRRILKRIGMARARKSPDCQAYFTTDHLRKIYSIMIEGAEKCLSDKIR
jgi:hypothetical protein